MHRFLWVSAHPDAHSLTANLRTDAIKHLCDGGHEVVESDLYAMGWNPVLGEADFASPQADGPAADEPLVVRQKAATLDGRLSDDIRAEQDKLRAADTVVLQFPLWWYGVPAILKGWFDRVLTSGFAFWLRDPETGRVRKYGDGGLAGRRVLTVVSAGDRATALGPRGISGDVEDVLWPLLHGTVHYTGMQPLRPHLISSADRVDASAYETERARLVARLDVLDAEEPIPFRTLASGEYDEVSRLRDEHAPGRTGLAIHRRPPVE